MDAVRIHSGTCTYYHEEWGRFFHNPVSLLLLPPALSSAVVLAGCSIPLFCFGRATTGIYRPLGATIGTQLRYPSGDRHHILRERERRNAPQPGWRRLDVIPLTLCLTGLLHEQERNVSSHCACYRSCGMVSVSSFQNFILWLN
jgi:hypothetical protein